MIKYARLDCLTACFTLCNHNTHTQFLSLHCEKTKLDIRVGHIIGNCPSCCFAEINKDGKSRDRICKPEHIV